MITDAIREEIHETPDLQLAYELIVAYREILGDEAEREKYLAWMLRNDPLFYQVSHVVNRELGCQDLKAIVIVLARLLNQRMPWRCAICGGLVLFDGTPPAKGGAV